jgi:nitroreductase
MKPRYLSVRILSCIDLILGRRSIRRYKREPIPTEVKAKILEAGRLAPSAANRQPWHFIVCESATAKEKLSKGRWSGFVKDAAFAVIGVAMPIDDTSRRFGVIDTTIALQNMVLAAEVQGVGSCWIGDFKEAEVKKEFDIPAEAIVVCIVAFGFPDEKPGPRKAKPLTESFHLEKW